MRVSVAWVLTQTGLALRLRGGAAGVGRPVDVVLTSELTDPSRWLSGNELVLTTGIRLPDTARGRAAYLRELDACGVAGLGFATGLTHQGVPGDMIEAADEIGLPLIEVPLETPFAAIVKSVTARIAELQYDDVLRVSRAQPHITRAVVTGGAQAVVRELSRALGATVLILDTAGAVLASHPDCQDTALLDELRTGLPSGADAGTTTVTVHETPTSVAHQRVRVGSKSYGELVVVGASSLSHIEQVLLGHANALLALDFDKPARLDAVQRQLNSTALSLLLNTAADLTPAWTVLARIVDPQRRIRVLSIECTAGDAMTTACIEAIEGQGRDCVVHVDTAGLIAVLPGDATMDVAGALDGRTRRTVRIGMSAAHPLEDLATAVVNARRAAAMAQRGGAPVEFGDKAGQALLSDNASREVLSAVAATLLGPLAIYDRDHHGGLVDSLRGYLEANGHWETAAAALGIHRHTLRNRIKTAQKLLGCDLDVARVRAELLLALLAAERR
ncbi:PucR family transcriptional regulator [Mycobacterium sp. BMJ-28]